ncbi:MAG TPA: response regulator transcription factor [Dyella sp.]|uniref:response regulator transcription factor n=1 Tax=Dyella sp. TaxID=1869338 RepID=UPI002F95C659
MPEHCAAQDSTWPLRMTMQNYLSSNPLRIRVVIADDHPAVLAGVEYLISDMRDALVIGTCPHAASVIDFLRTHACDVVVVDYTPPRELDADGLVLFSRLRRRFPALRIVVLTGLENREMLQLIMAAGVNSVISKWDDPEHLRRAIRAVYIRQRYFSPEIRRMIDVERRPAESDPTGRLSLREAEVIRLLATGMSVVEIGTMVGRSRKTISAQKLTAMKKLGLGSDADLYRYALASGLIHSSYSAKADALAHE